MSAWKKRDLVELALEFVPDLEEHQGESGVYYSGCCPMHQETHPSFVIYPNDGPHNARWECFAGCGSGDVLDMVMRVMNLTFKEAIKIATDKADEADIAIEIARRTFESKNYDFLLLAMRMRPLMDRLAFAEANRVYQGIDQAVNVGDYTEIERLLKRHDL